MKILFSISIILITTGCFKTSYDVRENDKISKIEERVHKYETQKADTIMSLSEMQTQLQSLKGRVEELDHKKEQVQSIQDKEKDALQTLIKKYELDLKTIELRIDNLESKYITFEKRFNTQKNIKQLSKFDEDAVSEVAHNKGKKSVSKEDKNEMILKKNNDTGFSKAISYLKENNVEDAQKEFAIFVKEHPQDSNVAEAYFWLGETYFIQENYTEAITHYRSVIQKHPKSRKVPEAMLKVAVSFEKLDMKKEATIFYEELFKAYPKTSQGMKAKVKLTK